MKPKREAQDYAQLGEAMHRWVDDIVGAWPVIDRIADEMGGGFPASTLGGRGGGGEDDGRTAALAVSAVIDPRWDPGQAGSDWEAHRIETVAHLRTLAREAARLKPMSRWLAERRTDEDPGTCVGCRQPVLSEVDVATGLPTRVLDKYGRPWHRECIPDDVDRCSECGELASETELFGGRVFHARELGTGCWWKAYNRTRGRRRAASE